MGCGCSTGSSSPSNRTQRVSTRTTVLSECEYTTELMVIWIDKLNCIKQQNLFAEIGFNKYKINFAIGTVQSAINTGNACLFQRQLDEINNIILSLINIDKC
jgi:hypothetical protein